MKRLVIVVLYIAQGLYTYGTSMAEWHFKDTHEFSVLQEGPRDDLGISVGIALLPLGFLPIALITNFNQHGWELWWKP